MGLVASVPSKTIHSRSWLAAAAVYWHLLSFDAPTVAALWSWSIAKGAHIELPILTTLLLALGTWLVYVAGRILDGMHMTRREPLRERHYFYAMHRQTFLFAGALIAPLFIWIVLTRMAPAARHEDAAVFAVATLYFLLVHIHGPGVERWLPKELAVGVLFAAATAVPAWARAEGSSRIALVPLIALYAILCWLNCVAIQSWEHVDASQEIMHQSTIWAEEHFKELAIVTALAGFLVASFSHVSARNSVCLAITAAALLLYSLALYKERLTAMHLRSLPMPHCFPRCCL